MGTDFSPRYYQIEQALRRRIAGRRPHDPLPSETELCAEFGVSRMTARAAVQRLVAENLVYRVSGRGTFVAEPPTRRRAENLVRFSEEMRRQGRKHSSTLISAELRPATDQEANRLILPNPATVVEIRRVRLADGIPTVLETAVFPSELSELLRVDFARDSVHATLIALGRTPTRGHSSIRAAVADEAEADLLDVSPGTALLTEVRLITDQHDQPLELTESRYVGDRYALDVAFEVDSSADSTP
ncbi:GntR family transcriptional regulator [Streptomyces sp. NRRL WC-3742]|uniref:GntR family transcriptional regulator n=1 Tax=Streptomyces sp. NRRL WC-3742 TaxID=1463934 RepID=UPI0004C583F4|nr:GntR family transcriptional regulator [Streptomyces sp. NRRL WC-3742]